MPRRPINPLIPLHERDRETFTSVLRKVSGCSGRTAEKIIGAYPGGAGLAEATRADLRALGATDRQAEAIHGAFELVKRVYEQQFRYKAALHQPSDVVGYLRAYLPTLEQETFITIFLDVKQRVIDVKESATGTVASVDVHPREVFRDAVRLRAHSVIVAHNHPSGQSDPSDADLQLTRRLVEAGLLVGIPVLDHLIIAGNDAISLQALGLVPRAA